MARCGRNGVGRTPRSGRGAVVVCGAVALFGFGVGCERSEPERAATPSLTAEEGAATAMAASDRLIQTLLARLGEAIAEGGPEGAISVCQDVAQEMTDQIASEEGIEIRRTALRVRNPENAPDAFEREVLERWVREGVPAAPERVVVEDADGGRTLRWMRPIRLADMCVTCHGTAEQVPEGVEARLAEFYPQDEAIGFAPGDLRGAFSARVPLD